MLPSVRSAVSFAEALGGSFALGVCLGLGCGWETGLGGCLAVAFEADFGRPLGCALAAGLSHCFTGALHLSLCVCLTGAFKVDGVKGSMPFSIIQMSCLSTLSGRAFSSMCVKLSFGGLGLGLGLAGNLGRSMGCFRGLLVSKKCDCGQAQLGPGSLTCLPVWRS